MSLKDKLLDTRDTSLYGLQGEKGPEFENEGQMFTSDIQARTTSPTTRNLQDSQDMLSGRLSQQTPLNPYYASPSRLSNKGQTPDQYKDNGPAEGRF